MFIELRNQQGNIQRTITLPSEEKQIQQCCNQLEMENSAFAKVWVSKVFSNDKMDGILTDKMFALDELNYLAKRLESFGEDEYNTFYAVATAQKLDQPMDLINLTFNTHCYNLLADFSDLNQLGKSMYLNDQGPTTTEFLKDFDGRKYRRYDSKQSHSASVTLWFCLSEQQRTRTGV